MSGEAYEALAKHLDEMPIGAPMSAELMEILRILFTPEEAELGSKLPLVTCGAARMRGRYPPCRSSSPPRCRKEREGLEPVSRRRGMSEETYEELRRLLEEVGEGAANLAELGIGTNDLATVSGNVLEDEKVLGTVHVAFGDNASMGGHVQVPLHVDGIIMTPTLFLDGEVILRDGVLAGMSGWRERAG